MNLPRRNRRAAFTLLECVAYAAVFLTILGMAFLAFYRAERNTRSLERNAADILRTLRAGEQWRQDLRRATAPVRQSGQGPDEELIVRQGATEVRYRFSAETVWRMVGTNTTAALEGVAASSMKPEPRGPVQAWRWELELKGRQPVARVKPFFTFLGVAPGQAPAVGPPPPTSR